MDKAMRIRKVLGGGMRQIGFMAAAGIYALDHHRKRLVEDHKKASEIAELLTSKSFVSKVEPTETNIVIFYVAGGKSEIGFMEYLLKRNVKISNMGQGRLRIVTHLDYTAESHERFLEILHAASI